MPLPPGYGQVFVNVPGSSKEETELLSGQALAKLRKDYEVLMDVNEEDRRALEDQTSRISSQRTTTGMGEKGKSQHVGRIPHVVYQYLMLTRGVEWLRSEEFGKWLDRHPEYKLGKTAVYL